MRDFKNIEGICFVGIGGIGMSALASYFARGGFLIAGYDRSESLITTSLEREGCKITYVDSPANLPALFTNPSAKDRILVIFTPAVSSENNILSFFRNNGYTICKRSEILGEISSQADTLAIAGTHGKTTVSTMTAHLLKQSSVDCTAFLGGISKNYNTNLLTGEGRYTVIEADEFDRSFLRLSPLMAVITAVDADHLDIYGDHATMIEAYNEFCGKIRPGGKLFINSRIRNRIIIPNEVTGFTYGADEGSHYRYFGIDRQHDYYSFHIQTPSVLINSLHFPFPGIINIENLTAAIAVALNCGVTEQEIRRAVIMFQGVRRRFDIRINLPHITYVDDYAHHPEEIRAFLSSARDFFRGRKITGIFQPHLFSRTRDNAEGFAAILDELDETILLPVYPAREKPIPGVSSEMILNMMRSPKKKLMRMEEIPDALDINELDVLVTIGAGDIEKLVATIENKIKNTEHR